jgi:hypothetical protein
VTNRRGSLSAIVVVGLLIVVILTGCGATRSASRQTIMPQPSTAPAAGPTLGSSVAWGVTADPAVPMAPMIDRDQSLLGRPVDILSAFISSTLQPSTQSSIIDALRAESAPTRTIMITWEPGTATGARRLDSQSVSIRGLAAGRQDEAAIAFLSQLANFPGPVVLRFAHEMNGSWYPWAGDPSTFILAWDRVRTLQAKVAPAVRMAWSVNNDDRPSTNTLESYWPGRSKVDIIGIDGYNCLRGWESPSTVFGSAYKRVTVLDPTAPIWITETASCEAARDVSGSGGKSKAEWIAQLLATTNLPAISAIVWFDRDKEFDWRIDSSTAATAALRRGLQK